MAAVAVRAKAASYSELDLAGTYELSSPTSGTSATIVPAVGTALAVCGSAK